MWVTGTETRVCYEGGWGRNSLQRKGKKEKLDKRGKKDRMEKNKLLI